MRKADFFMIILSVDQGIAHFGYAILDVKADSISLVDYGCFISQPNGNQQVRIYNLISKFEDLITKYNPSYVTHERLFFSPPAKNSRKKSSSILNTNMVTGAIWYMCGKHAIEAYEYPPQSVKKTLCGDGRAEKDSIITYIESLFDITSPKTHREHICDAIAIGMTYIMKNNIQQLLAEQEKEVENVHNAG